MNIPFNKPILPKNFDSILTESIKNGWLTSGPVVKKFEDKISSIASSKHVVAVNSCTAALHLALASKSFSKNDQFIVPTYTFVASVEVGEYLGMEPILIDTEAEGFNLDLNQVEDYVKNNRNVKAIIPVHFAGKAVNMHNVNLIADKYGLFVLEDAAHALESVSNVGKVGNTKHATAFSFYANKNITTFGEGGAVATNDSSLAERIRLLSLHGMSKDGWNRFKIGGKWGYDVSELGYKYNLTDAAAAFGLWQLKYLDEWHQKRKNIVDEYQSSFLSISGLICPKFDIGLNDAYHLYILRIIPQQWKINRNQIIEKLNELGIGTSVHYIPVHMHSYYQKKYRYKNTHFPNSKLLSETVISLPLYPDLEKHQVDYIINTLLELWNSYKE